MRAGIPGMEAGPSPGPARRFGVSTATLVVMANMIGTGVFTTTGLLLQDISSASVILLAWGLGGLIALCGAWTYGELAAAISSNGGEYRFLGSLYHPAVGFVAGWLSLVVGFSAPIAASALAFGEYVHAVWPGVPVLWAGASVIVFSSLLHGLHVSTGAGVQNLFAVLKVLLILGFIAFGARAVDLSAGFGRGADPVSGAAWSPGFAVGLIFISFAYSGWNGAAYLAGEVRRPQTTLPRALAVGTGLVVLLYVGLNAVVLASAPASELAGRVDVGHVAATHLLGPAAGRVFSGLIAAALVSSVSAMILVGPRVYEAMGADYRALRWLSVRPRKGGPVAAITLQAVLALVMLVTASFGALLTYIGITLSVSTAMAVAGVFVLRRRGLHRHLRVRTWGYPVTPTLFLVFSGWMVCHGLVERPVQALFSGLTIIAGFIVYLLVMRSRTRFFNSSTEGGHTP